MENVTLNQAQLAMRVLQEMDAGKSLEEAMDAVFGKGAYQRLMDEKERRDTQQPNG